MSQLAGKRAVVSGAGSGIGRETAKICAREGAQVGVLDRDETAGWQTVQEIEAGGGEGIAVIADLRHEEQVAAAVRQLVDAWGGLDTVIGCAGVQLAGRDDRAHRLAMEAWQETIDVNLTGMFLLCKHGIGALLDSGAGGSAV